jgi:hypothetical protein
LQLGSESTFPHTHTTPAQSISNGIANPNKTTSHHYSRSTLQG